MPKPLPKEFLLSRGSCCKNGCKNCPYGYNKNKNMTDKVDVIIQVYGKPYQTICTLKSLIKHSGKWIDKIYFLEEFEHPFGDKVKWVVDKFDNIIHHKYDKKVNIYGIKSKDVPLENIRHQFGIENSNKKYVFVTHNDVLYTEDIIGNMLENIGDNVGIGEIGQCWNCPAKAKGLCSGETFYDYNPTYEEVIALGLPHIRTRIDNVSKLHPKPLPECRLNEWACLIDREACIKEGRPFFGEFDDDSGTEWFKAMHFKGYKFKDYRKDFIHMYWANTGGHQVEQHKDLYRTSEEVAKKYYELNFK